MKGNTEEIHIGSEGELSYKYINHHAGTPTKAKGLKTKVGLQVGVPEYISEVIEKDKS